MDFITAKEAAGNWGITQRHLALLCSENLIEGAKFIGDMWLIPRNAQKPERGSATRLESTVDMKIKPFLKWAGGKSQILDSIRKKYPDGLGTSIKKYAEPFVGGGAVLFDILGKYDMDDVYVSDINKELIQTYISLRDSADDMIHALRELEKSTFPQTAMCARNFIIHHATVSTS